jgi:hypothetical protein
MLSCRLAAFLPPPSRHRRTRALPYTRWHFRLGSYRNKGMSHAGPLPMSGGRGALAQDVLAHMLAPAHTSHCCGLFVYRGAVAQPQSARRLNKVSVHCSCVGAVCGCVLDQIYESACVDLFSILMIVRTNSKLLLHYHERIAYIESIGYGYRVESGKCRSKEQTSAATSMVSISPASRQGISHHPRIEERHGKRTPKSASATR